MLKLVLKIYVVTRWRHILSTDFLGNFQLILKILVKQLFLIKMKLYLQKVISQASLLLFNPLDQAFSQQIKVLNDSLLIENQLVVLKMPSTNIGDLQNMYKVNFNSESLKQLTLKSLTSRVTGCHNTPTTFPPKLSWKKLANSPYCS